jgi:hypothetical protein
VRREVTPRDVTRSAVPLDPALRDTVANVVHEDVAGARPLRT